MTITTERERMKKKNEEKNEPGKNDANHENAC